MTRSNEPISGSNDRAGRGFWDGLWSARRKTRVVSEEHLSYPEAQYAAMFERAFAALGRTTGKRLLEAGCGDSAWLPWFAARWGFRITGLDYSAVGCESAAALARASGIDADIVCADLFAPPAEMLERFDVVVSMGLVEHFDDTAGALQALSRFLKPEGVLITTVPNIAGLDGKLMKWINPALYAIHVPLDAEALMAAHEQAGLDLLECRYLMAVNLGVVNAAGLAPARLSTKLKELFVLGLIAASRVVWKLEQWIHPLPVRPFVSPYIAAIARRPKAGASP